MSRRRRRTWRGLVWELVLAVLLVLLLVNFAEPVMRWAGEYIGDALERTTTEQGQ